MKTKIESTIDSWNKIDALHLSEVKDEIFNEMSDKEFKSLLKELKLLDKDGGITKKAFHNIILSTYWHYPKTIGKVKLDRFAPPDRYFMISPKGIVYLEAKLKRKERLLKAWL